MARYGSSWGGGGSDDIVPSTTPPRTTPAPTTAPVVDDDDEEEEYVPVFVSEEDSTRAIIDAIEAALEADEEPVVVINISGTDGLEVNADVIEELIAARGSLVIITEIFVVTFTPEQLEGWDLPEGSTLTIIVRPFTFVPGATAGKNVLIGGGIGSGLSLVLDVEDINEALRETNLEILFLVNNVPTDINLYAQVEVDISDIALTPDQLLGLTAVQITDMENDVWTILPSQVEGAIVAFYASRMGVYGLRVIGAEQLTPPTIGAVDSGDVVPPPIVTGPITLDAGAAPAFSTMRLTVGSNVYQLDGVDHVSSLGTPFIDVATGRTMVPIRFIAESLGADVDWDAATRTAYLNRGAMSLALSMDSDLYVDSSNMGRPANVAGNLYVPLAFVAHHFGVTVTWDGEARAIYIAQ